MGSITFRKKRRTYYYRYRIQINGVWKEKSINLETDSYSKALEYKEIYDNNILQGKNIKSQQNATLADYVSALIEQKKYHKVGTNTIDMYKTITRQLIDTDLGTVPIRKIKSNDIEYLLRGLDYSYSHLHKWHITIKQLLDMAVRDGVVPRNIAQDVKITWKKSKNRKRVFSQDELKAIFHEADRMDSIYGTQKGKLYRLLYYTGARRTELILFHRDWYIRDKKYILIPGDESKSGRSTPKYLNTKAQEIIEWFIAQYPDHERPILQDRSPIWYPGNVTTQFGRMLKKLGIKGANLHTFRHTFASYLSANAEVGMFNVKTLAGHQDIRTTQGYSHAIDDQLLNAVEKLPEIDVD